MIKKIFYLFLVCFSFIAYGQETKLSDQKNMETDSVVTVADELPEFPGGINAFRMEIQKNFNPDNISGKGRLTSEATFVVDKTGKIVNIKYTGDRSLGKAMIRSISKIKKNCKPARINGEPVNYLFRFPLTMNFE